MVGGPLSLGVFKTALWECWSRVRDKCIGSCTTGSSGVECDINTGKELKDVGQILRYFFLFYRELSRKRIILLDFLILFFTKYCLVDCILPEHLRGASLPGINMKFNNTSSLP